MLCTRMYDAFVCLVAMVSTTRICVEDSNDNPPECLLNPYVAGEYII